MQAPVSKLGAEQFVLVGLRIRVVIAVDAPHLGFVQDPFKLALQRLLRLDVTQQADRSSAWRHELHLFS